MLVFKDYLLETEKRNIVTTDLFNTSFNPNLCLCSFMRFWEVFIVKFYGNTKFLPSKSQRNTVHIKGRLGCLYKPHIANESFRLISHNFLEYLYSIWNALISWYYKRTTMIITNVIEVTLINMTIFLLWWKLKQ